MDILPLLFNDLELGLTDMDLDHVAIDIWPVYMEDDTDYALIDEMDLDVMDPTGIPPPSPLIRSFVDYIAMLIDPLI